MWSSHEEMSFAFVEGLPDRTLAVFQRAMASPPNQFKRAYRDKEFCGPIQAERNYEILIQDVFRHIACVNVISRDMMDYLHLARLNDQWLIVNVLWELR